MNQGITTIMLFFVSTFYVYAQTKVTLQNNISKNFVKYEYNFLDGRRYTKRAGESWTLVKHNNNLILKGTKESFMMTEVTYLDGTSFYTLDNQTWHQKSFISNELSIENEYSYFRANYDENSTSIEIECNFEMEQQVYFYLMSPNGDMRILIGKAFLYQGVNKLQMNVEKVKRGSYFLIMDQNTKTKISKIIIF